MPYQSVLQPQFPNIISEEVGKGTPFPFKIAAMQRVTCTFSSVGYWIVLKMCGLEIAPILQVIFTQSLTMNSIPADDWLLANVVPIFKKGTDLHLAAIYRSLTSICCKLMEHVMYTSIMDYFTQHHILTNQQYDVGQERSYKTQLVEDIRQALDQQKK